MNKQGFTLVELLAVIIILSLIVTMASISITKTKKDANEKEKVALKQTIESAFQNYRIDNTVAKNSDVLVSNFKFTTDLSYSNKKCNYGDSVIKYVVKKDKLNVINSVKDITQEQITALQNKLNDSEEEVFCLQFYCNKSLIINDMKDAKTNEILIYSGDTILATEEEINNAKAAGQELTTIQFKVNYCQ